MDILYLLIPLSVVLVFFISCEKEEFALLLAMV
jgi:hypothetical protein